MSLSLKIISSLQAPSDLFIDTDTIIEEIVESWDVLKEPKPNHKVYSDSFQQALLDGSLIGTSLSAALRQVEEYKFKFDRQKELKIYQQEAEVLENFSFSDGMTIGVLGQTGVGKSSLICSLTGVPGIAETSCLGASCTSVPIEYRKKTDHHSSVFHVEIVHFSGEELTDYVKELVFDYVRYWLPSAADADADEYKELEQSHVTAWTCLSTAFGKQQKDFDTESWKKEAHEGQYQRITEMFAKWTEQLQWPDGVNESGVWTADANSIEEWRKALSAFTKQGLWPFIKVVRNFSDSELLKTGIVIADLPGFGDTNLARVRATQQYLMRCDHLFMLTKITRAITDESLQSIIEKSMEKYASIDLKANARSQLALSIVCTHSESIDEDDVLESFCCEGGLIDPEEMKAFDEKMENAKSQKVYYQLQREKKLLLISARNTHVQNGLQEVYGGRIPGLKVFCISNRLYSKCVVKDKTLWGTHVETSGIPELRKYCRLLAAEDQYRDGENFLVSKISALLNKVSIWIETRAMSHFATNLDPRIAQQLVADVDSAKVAMTKTLHDHRKSFRTAIDDHVLSLFREHSNEWNDAALAKFKEFVWPNWHWTSFGAFIRHSGFRDKGKHKDEDWNQQLSEKMRSDITVPWDAYADGVPAELEKVYNDIERGFQALKPKFEREYYHDSISDILNCAERLQARKFRKKSPRASTSSLGTFKIPFRGRQIHW